MKKVTEPETRNVANAWGQYSDTTCQEFEVEPSDVGHTRPDYRGEGYSKHKFTQADVGRRIQVLTKPPSAYTCWVFAS